MAIDIRKGSHIVSFPTKVASMMGQKGHVFNIVLTADTDNGVLSGKGTYVHYDQYEQDTPSSSWAGVVRDIGSDGNYEVETTALPTSEVVLYLFNDPVSEYDNKDFQDESLFYSKAGERIQGAELSLGDVISVSANGFTGGTPAIGDPVTFANGKYVI